MIQYPSITPTNKGTPNSTYIPRNPEMERSFMCKPCLANPAAPTAHFTTQVGAGAVFATSGFRFALSRFGVSILLWWLGAWGLEWFRV